MGNKVTVKIQPEKGTEEMFFLQQDLKKMKELRERCLKEATERYREEHKYHCFRCGSKSLVEIDRGDVKIDICINEDCGAVHLDPGELERILKDEKVLGSIRKAFLDVFK
ncbi:MAG: zf-TFIIB domain-containing protein [Deltaproteobacteria bacterium]|nr:zf-TFIIB domain-containing protein [Deltaproteobacteria bacterium]